MMIGLGKSRKTSYVCVRRELDYQQRHTRSDLSDSYSVPFCLAHLDLTKANFLIQTFYVHFFIS